jgi:outer membrane assembly lipoprotein YfiO
MRVKGALCAAILGVCTVASAASTWELRGNRWIEVPEKAPATAPVAEPLLDQAEAMIRAGNYKSGAKTAVSWLRGRAKDAPQRDRALMLVAEGYFLDGKRVDAFYYLDQLMDEHPESSLYNRALQRQYEIADAYLNGYQRVFIWFPILDADDEAIDMLFRIQQRSPGSAMAEKALLRTADYYYNNSDFDLAADAYSVYLHSYPRSPLLPRVRLKRAYSTLAQFRGTRYDATPLIDARAQLLDLVNAYPDIADQEGLPDLVRRIDDTFAAKIYRTADFYRRTDEPKAAIYNYRFLIATFPNSPEAKLAAKRLTKFKPQYLADTPPRPGESYAPVGLPEPEVR